MEQSFEVPNIIQDANRDRGRKSSIHEKTTRIELADSKLSIALGFTHEPIEDVENENSEDFQSF
jgi:hypothetical protein